MSDIFQMNDFGNLKRLLGIEVAQSNTGIAIVPRKYHLDILEKTSLTDCKLDAMDQNVKLVPGLGENVRRL